MKLRAGAILATALLGASAALPGADPGRLEADAGFLLGRWSSDCAAGLVEIYLNDGALRQKGLLRVVPKGGEPPVTPETLLAATRDGPGVVLEARTDTGGFDSSARYTASIESTDRLSLKAMTLCREQRCQTVSLDVPWTRCP